MIQPEKTVLSNGVRLISEYHENASAVHVGFWFLTGSRDEDLKNSGVSHFLEHLVFKGTKKRSPYEIALALESVGGDLNAFTTKEYTCYQTLSLKDHAELSLDVLSDLVLNPSIPVKEFDREKKVVQQEISMSKEEYSEYIFDVFLEKSFPRKAIGQPILGTEESVRETTRKDVLSYHKERYFSGNMIVTVVGAISHKELIQSLEKKLTKIPKQGTKVRRRKPTAKNFREVVQCPSEQVHVLLGMPTSSYKDDDRYESYFISTLLGGGMTSKLYQSLREKQGLAYSVYSYLYTFVDTALSMVYFATDKPDWEKAIELTMKHFRQLRTKGVSRKDLELYKTQMRGNLLLSLDDLENRMSTLAHNEMIFGRQRSVEEIIADIDEISQDSVMAYIEKYVAEENLSWIVMGDLKH